MATAIAAVSVPGLKPLLDRRNAKRNGVDMDPSVHKDSLEQETVPADKTTNV